jgi:hypothetical protein
MATVLGRVPLDQIGSHARRVRFGRTLQTVIAAVLYGIGWVLNTVLRTSLFAVGWVANQGWQALVWAGMAVRLGWVEAQAGGRRGPA